MLRAAKDLIIRRFGMHAHATTGGTPPGNTVIPVITGDVAGETSTTSDGTWSGSPTAFTYQWYLDGALLDGETANSIDTDVSWAGQTLTVVVTAYNAGGTASAGSAGVVLTAPFEGDFRVTMDGNRRVTMDGNNRIVSA